MTAYLEPRLRITNECENDCWSRDEICDCFYDHVDNVREFLGDWWESQATYIVDGLPLWNRGVRYQFTPSTVNQFIASITVNSTWVLYLSWNVDGKLDALLYHHDVPTGRPFTITKKVEVE